MTKNPFSSRSSRCAFGERLKVTLIASSSVVFAKILLGELLHFAKISDAVSCRMDEDVFGPAVRRIDRGLRSRRRLAPNSFTLLEVVISIAVIAFVLVSILGLMAYTSQLVQQTDTYSRLSNVTGQVLTQFDSQPYEVSTNCATTNAVYYFSYEGLPTNGAGAYYQCNVTNADAAGWTLTNVMQIQLSVRWPKPQFTNTNVIITSTLDYD